MIQWNHAPEAVWSYTPRQIAAWHELGLARQRVEASERLIIGTMAARGKNEVIAKQLRDWEE